MYDRWDRAERPHAYLRTSVFNACNTWYRQNGIRRTKLALLAAPDRTELVADELSDAIAVLPIRQRSVIVLRYYYALSEAEIAEALGCRPGTVKSLAARALRRLASDIAA